MKLTCPHCGKTVKVRDIEGRMDEPLVRCSHCRKIFFTREPAPSPIEDESDLFEEKGPPPDLHAERHRQSKRYLVLVVLLLVSVLAYQTFEYIRKEAALNHVRNVSVKKMLRKIAAAQEAYHAGHGGYTDQLEELTPYFRSRGSTVITIELAGPSSWKATAYHPRSPLGYIYDSSARVMHIKEFERDESSAR